ncbi:acyltransferase family protein [Larkinella rosea]|uniref:DUF1624 domain-containing protein n=1 Tax=Larkinella rosea TaxID=2025312 RepID=A0A3P1BBK9_9BACT|nr:heparan-alpha-glucosaminide N-acetyltransferase domain-containing protein [Larkinella rosea]RRA98053.1 DUF1624 domain-containing protein [Larkinella rosea]
MEQLSTSKKHGLKSVGTARLLSLDTFRGITVAAMILVNNPGDWGHIYAPLGHAHWHGWTPTDLVFPFFLFIVGVSISYALQNKQRAGLVGKIVKRSLILFGLGLFLNLFPKFDLTTVRIPGVLQRIALVYLACSLIYIKTDTKTQGWLIGILLVGYWLLMSFVPVPDFGSANLDPETNLGAWFDRTLLGGQHLWKTAKVWDPEGLLSTLPAVATGLSGIRAGTLLKSNRSEAEKTAWLFVAGCLSLIGAYVWNGFFPINKSLWTSSFVLLTSGLALQALALCYWLIDVQGYQRWTKPFVAFGVNAITVFFLSGLIPRLLNMIKTQQPDGTEMGGKEWLYQTFFVTYFESPYNASLAGALTFVLIWFVILYVMYQKKIIIKI